MRHSAFTWQSKKHTSVALSKAEAYIGLAGAAQYAVSLKLLYQVIADTLDKPVLINEDNQEANAISRNPQYHRKVKHIDIKYYFIREQVHNLNIELQYCCTSKTIADMLTKGLGRVQLQKSRELAGIKELTVCK
uniref:Reverse transcriptase Ty1/copia-type domain-containing protein n=1 Tax=Amphimedon queenslandica TaxID=400682 RepID=A0A1X7UD12_AMPQE